MADAHSEGTVTSLSIEIACFDGCLIVLARLVTIVRIPGGDPTCMVFN